MKGGQFWMRSARADVIWGGTPNWHETHLTVGEPGAQQWGSLVLNSGGADPGGAQNVRTGNHTCVISLVSGNVRQDLIPFWQRKQWVMHLLGRICIHSCQLLPT